MQRLERQRAGLPAASAANVERLMASRDEILKRMEVLVPATLRATKTRLHGDYHLGQVLVAQNDFIITDFEGEPMRTLAERREKISALKDVAGMLRSFNYAMYQGLGAASAERPDALAALESAGREWERETRRAFLDAYEERARAAGALTMPSEARPLLELFMFEKAFYELDYEVDHRPDWVRIPLAGILEVASGAW